MKKTSSSYCKTCQRQTLHAKEGASNLLHLVLTIVTVGLWLPVWLLIGLRSGTSRQRCQVCGSK